MAVKQILIETNCTNTKAAQACMFLSNNRCNDCLMLNNVSLF